MPRPVLQAFLLADHVYRDEATKKAIIAGTFNQISAAKFPAARHECWAYLSLTDLRGNVSLDLQLRNLSTNEVVLATGKVPLATSTDPNRTAEFICGIETILFPDPGSYSFDAVWEEEILGSLRIVATLRTEQEKP